jgi:hypothetical protein
MTNLRARSLSARALLPAAPLALLLAGCPKEGGTSSPTDAGTIPQGTAAMLTERVTADGLTQVEVDLDGDKKPEIVNYYRMSEGSKLLLRKDVDLNRDGRMDVRTTFDEAGLRVQEEMDGDFDGRVDWVDEYIQGKRSMTKVDTDYNGSFDLFKYYENGRVRRKERDTDGNGKIDFWEYLDEQGAVVKTGRDKDGDGVMDERSN